VSDDGLTVVPPNRVACRLPRRFGVDSGAVEWSSLFLVVRTEAGD
jgi:hypothetical protein